MTLIANQQDLNGLCARLSTEPYVTVDTEFMRERTYWPILCVVQLGGAKEAAAVDALARTIDLAPVYDLMRKPDVLKVFHAARQDVEIFFHRGGAVPAPIFDTQIAGMVCGFGDAVAYETLVQKLARGTLDKSARFTDWSARPLTERQITYALADVTHLRKIYEKLRARLEDTGRASWLEAEMAILTDPATYQMVPEESWRRLKVRTRAPRFLAILREVAAWREHEALPNVESALVLDVTADPWPVTQADVVVNINMIHISPWSATEGLMRGAGAALSSGGLLFMYGPYKIDGKHTAPSNESFDASLRSRDPSWGVRNLPDVAAEAELHGLHLVEHVAMPANNFSVIYRKR